MLLFDNCIGKADYTHYYNGKNIIGFAIVQISRIANLNNELPVLLGALP